MHSAQRPFSPRRLCSPTRGSTRLPLLKSQRPASINLEKTCTSQDSAALGAADSVGNAPIDPRIKQVIERWPALSEAVKADIIALVQQASE